MKIKNVLAISLVMFVFFSCNSKKKAAAIETKPENQITTASPNPHPLDILPESKEALKEKYEAAKAQNNLFAYLRKGYCYGECPVFEITIYKDGFAAYEGKANVPNIGKFATLFSKEEMDLLAKFADDINYFGLQDKYNPGVADLPATTTKLSINGKTKSIENVMNAPEGLKNFEKYFIEMIKTKKLNPIGE